MQGLNIINEILLRSNDISSISIRMAHEMQRYYKNYEEEEKILALAVKEGAFNFARDVLCNCSDFEIKTIKASYYYNDTQPSKVMVELGKCEEFKKRHILIIDDIYDTGRTFHAIIEEVKKLSPLSVECCVMLEREGKHSYDIKPRFVGHKITTKDFLVGGGLDFKGKLRDLPYIGTLKMENANDKGIEEIHKVCLCNKCGESCAIKFDDHRESFYGLINATAKGHYLSPILSDLLAYRFDICERCLKEYFDSFKIPVDELEYNVWTGDIYK